MSQDKSSTSNVAQRCQKFEHPCYSVMCHFLSTFLAVLQAVSLLWNTLHTPPCPHLVKECSSYTSQLAVPFSMETALTTQDSVRSPICVHPWHPLFGSKELLNPLEDTNPAPYGSPMLGTCLAQRSPPVHFVA